MSAVSLSDAVEEARRIRRKLVRLRGDTNLGGDCALASLVLADLIGVRTLRWRMSLFGGYQHVFNAYRGHIIDITASQFNRDFRRDVGKNCDAVVELLRAFRKHQGTAGFANDPSDVLHVRGVLVTRDPWPCHRPIVGRGRAVLAYCSDWYDEDVGDGGYPRYHQLIERLTHRSGSHIA